MHLSETTRGLTKVLIVDDDPFVVRVLRLHIQGHGFTVVASTSPAEAIEIVEAGGIDVIVTDLNMPGMSGLELARRVRATKDGDFIRLIVLSAHLSDEDRAQALTAGCDKFYDKANVDIADLMATIDALAAECRAAKDSASWQTFARGSDIFA